MKPQQKPEEKQNYSNHIRYYVPHHFVFYPVMLALMAIGIYLANKRNGEWLIWVAFTVLCGVITWLSFMLRQHYALNNQNRIVRLEMRLRYYQLTHQPFESIEQQLAFGQLAALRFASDSELLTLITRTLNEGLAPKQIKRSIKTWIPDHMRV